MAEALAVVKVGKTECGFLKLTPTSRTAAMTGAVSAVTLKARRPSATNRRRLLGRFASAASAPLATTQDHVRHERDQFRRVSATAVGVARAPTVVDLQVATDGPAQLLQPLCQRGDAARRFRVVGGQVHQCADAPHALALLRSRR